MIFFQLSSNAGVSTLEARNEDQTEDNLIFSEDLAEDRTEDNLSFS